MSLNSIKLKIRKLVEDPSIFAKRGLSIVAPLIRNDKLFIKIKWRISKMGYPLNLDHPKTFCEKLQWLKLYDRRPEYTTMVDKIKVKKWVTDRIGSQYIIPTLGVWGRPEDIDFEKLPDQFVLKCNHNSGGVYICQNKSNMDIEKVIKRLRRELKQNYFWRSREWPYKCVRPMILAEQYMNCNANKDLIDYKFYCFNGNPRYCQVIQNRSTNETIDFFDMQWQHQEFVGLRSNIKQAIIQPAKPQCLGLMQQISARLSQGIPFVRIDLYEINGQVFFGEITFFPLSGFGRFNPPKWNYYIGNEIKIKYEPWKT